MSVTCCTPVRSWLADDLGKTASMPRQVRSTIIVDSSRAPHPVTWFRCGSGSHLAPKHRIVHSVGPEGRIDLVAAAGTACGKTRTAGDWAQNVDVSPVANPLAAATSSHLVDQPSRTLERVDVGDGGLGDAVQGVPCPARSAGRVTSTRSSSPLPGGGAQVRQPDFATSPASRLARLSYPPDSCISFGWGATGPGENGPRSSGIPRSSEARKPEHYA